MRFPLPILTWAAGITLLTSCTPTFYSTVGQNVPMFHNKGEVTLSGGIMSAGSTVDGINPLLGNGPGIALQTAVAVDSSVAVFASYYHLDDNDDWNVVGDYIELGGGLFTYKPKTSFATELFAGIGYGTIDNSLTGEEINVAFVKYFLQPSTGFSGRVFEVAFTPRLGLVDYLAHSPSDRSDVQDYFNNKQTTFVFEPGLTLRLGFKNFKVQYQMNYSTFTFNQPQSTDIDPVMKYYGSFSFFAAISRLWNR